MASKLVNACMENREKNVLTMLAAGNDINEFDSRGFSPLVAACHYGHQRLARVLIKRGATVDLAHSETGQTPLHHAAKEGHTSVVKALIRRHGADVSKTDVVGRTALHWACIGKKIETVKVLIKYGATVELADASGYTPFLIAVEHGRTDTANLLLRHGAGLQSQNKLQHNALEIADWYGHKELVRRLMALYKNNNSEEGEGKATDESKAGEDGVAGAGADASTPGGGDSNSVAATGAMDAPMKPDSAAAGATAGPNNNDEEA